MNPKRPFILAFTSGKGGVGKTMLAVACAKEMAAETPTLIIDLDFFNRGLTGLFREGQPIGVLEKLSVLVEKEASHINGEEQAAHEKGSWAVINVAPNLFHISYPEVGPEALKTLAVLDPNSLKESISNLIQEASSMCGAKFVVLDCHGGPDNSSFAACLLADHVLLVSEPDKITFYGTLNFVSQLESVCVKTDIDLKAIDIRLVFNKVIPAFSGFFLEKYYNRVIKEVFHGRPLLGIFPLELYLTKEFEKTPLLTSVFPNSLLAKKMRVLLHELLHANHSSLLPKNINCLPGIVRAVTKRGLGKTPALLNPYVILVMFGILSILFVALGEKEKFIKGSTEKAVNDLNKLELIIAYESSESFRRLY